MNEKSLYYKKRPTDKVWWKDTGDMIGRMIFSFDRVNDFNLFSDYPWKLSDTQKMIFDKENPRWADYFSDRS